MNRIRVPRKWALVLSVGASLLAWTGVSRAADAPNAGPSLEQEQGRALEVIGVVEVLEQDDDGSVHAVRVGEHEVSDFGVGMDLLDLVGRKVRVTGVLFTDEYGSSLLDVNHYEVQPGER